MGLHVGQSALTNNLDQARSGSRRHENKRSTAEKNVGLSVLQQYFSGSLKDAAKSMGGVEGGLKFDPTTEEFVAAGPIIQEIDSQKSLFPNKNLCVKNAEPASRNAVSVPSAPGIDELTYLINLEDDDCSIGGNQIAPSRSNLVTNACEGELKKSNVSLNDCSGNSKLVAINTASCQQASLQIASGASPENASLGSYGIVEHNQPTSSGMTDSSNRSASMIHGSSTSSLEEQKHSKVKTSSVDRRSKITVKATYREDTIRFKFEPSVGCFQLYEEVQRGSSRKMGHSNSSI
ncbi:protein NLP8-like [Fagus crenata]